MDNVSPWYHHMSLQESILQDGRATFLIFQALYLGLVAVFVTVLFQLNTFDGSSVSARSVILLLCQLLMFVMIGTVCAAGVAHYNYGITRVRKRGNIVQMIQQIVDLAESNLLAEDLNRLGFFDHQRQAWSITPTSMIKIAERPIDLLDYLAGRTGGKLASASLFEPYSITQLQYIGWLATGDHAFYSDKLSAILREYRIVGKYGVASPPINPDRDLHRARFKELWFFLVGLNFVAILFWLAGVIHQLQILFH